MCGSLEFIDLTEPKSHSFTESSEISTFSLINGVRFDVPMEQAVFVHVIKGSEYLRNNSSYPFFRNWLLAIYLNCVRSIF